MESYSQVPIKEIKNDIKKWRLQEMAGRMGKTKKGPCTKNYFPTVKDRLSIKLKINYKLTALLSRHGLSKSYYFRFNIQDNELCSCQEERQTIHHIIYTCNTLQNERIKLKEEISRKGETQGVGQLCEMEKWETRKPTLRNDLILKYSELLYKYVNAIDFEKLENLKQVTPHWKFD